MDFSSHNNTYIVQSLTSFIPLITKQMIDFIKNNKNITDRNLLNIEPIMKNIVRLNSQIYSYVIPDGFDYRQHMSPIRLIIQENPSFISALATFLITYNSNNGINTGFAHIVDNLLSKGVMISDMPIYKEHSIIIGMKKYLDNHTNGFTNIDIITTKNKSTFNNNSPKQMFMVIWDVYTEFRPDDSIVTNLLDKHKYFSIIH